MIKPSIEYINCQLFSLGYFEKVYSLCEIITKGNKTFPAEYKNKGEYTEINNFDKYNGVCYIRKNGDVSVSEADDSLRACTNLSNVSMPLKLVAVIPRKKIEVDNNFTEDIVAQRLIKALITKSSDFKIALSAKSAKVLIDSYSTNSIGILSGEYSGISKKDINYKFIYISLDISINALVSNDCLVQDCGYGFDDCLPCVGGDDFRNFKDGEKHLFKDSEDMLFKQT